MNPVDDQLQKLGYSDCFYQDGDRWGFLHDGVMPQPIPQEIIDAAAQHDKRDRLADWPSFSRWEKVRFWCDRVLHNLKFKISREHCLRLENIFIRSEKVLILGESEYIDYFQRLIALRWETHLSRRIYSLILQRVDASITQLRNPSASKKQVKHRSLTISITPPVEIIDTNDKSTSFVVDRSNQSRVLATSCNSSFAIGIINEKLLISSKIWLICRCDRELAEVVAVETGYPASYFYGLPSHLFWVYDAASKKLLLAEIEDRYKWKYAIKNTPSPPTLRSLIQFTAKGAWEGLRAFRPGVPELCGLVVVGGAIAAGSGAGMILDRLFNVVVFPRCIFRMLELRKRHTAWEFEPLPMSLRSVVILAMLWQWATIFGSESWIGVLLAPLLGMLYSGACTLILLKIAYSYSR